MTATTPNYSCLLPPSFTGLTDVDDFITQFESVASLSNWGALNPDPRPHFFSARLAGDALTFYRSLTTAQQGSFDELKRLFRQQYRPNADVLKAQVKSLRQLPGQDVSSFYRSLRDLAGKAYADVAVRNEIIQTTFVEGLANSVVRWEVRKAKPASVEDAVSLAVEMQSYLNIHGQQPENVPPSTVNNIAGTSTSQSDMFSDLIFTIKEEVKRVVDERNDSNQRGRSSERSTNNRSQSADKYNKQSQGQNRNWHQGQRNRNNSRGNTPNRGNSQDSKNRVSFNNNSNNSSNKEECARCHRTNHATKDCKACFKCGRVGHFRRDCRSRSQNLN